MNRSVEREAEHVYLGLVPRHWVLGGIPVTHRCVECVHYVELRVGGSAAVVEGDNPIFHIL